MNEPRCVAIPVWVWPIMDRMRMINGMLLCCQVLSIDRLKNRYPFHFPFAKRLNASLAEFWLCVSPLRRRENIVFCERGGSCRRVDDAEEWRVIDSILLVAIVSFAESTNVETADDEGRRKKGLRVPLLARPSQLRSKSVWSETAIRRVCPKGYLPPSHAHRATKVSPRAGAW